MVSRRRQKCAPSLISLVKMSLGLMKDDGGGAVSADLADFGFVEVNMFYPLVCKGRSPRNRSSVVIIDGNCLIGFRHAKISGAKFDPEKFEGALVGNVDLSLA